MGNGNQDDRWLWFIDDAPLQALLRAEAELPSMKMRAASSPAVVRAVSLHLEGRMAEAAVELESAAAAGDRHPDVYLLLGQILFEARRLEEAAAAYARLAELDPAHPTAAFNLAVCRLGQGHWAEAVASFAEALHRDAGRVESYLGLGIAWLHAGEGEHARDAFEHYLADDPESEPARFGRAAALQLLGRYAAALEGYQALLASDGIHSEVLRNCVAAAGALRDPASMSRYAQQLLKLQPDSAAALEALAVAALYTGEHRVAAGYYEALLSTAASEGEIPPDIAWNLALAARDAGDRAAAVEGLSELVARDRQRPEAWFLLGELLAEDPGRPAEAAKAFAEALRLRPDWLDAQFNFGLLAWRAGHSDRALQAFESAAVRDPQAAPVWEAIAQLALERGDAARAAKAIDTLTAQGATPSRALRFNLALALQRAGRAKEAAQRYRALIETDPDFSEAWINLGHALEALGDVRSARACWERVPAPAPAG